jgi:hypothetical protein
MKRTQWSQYGLSLGPSRKSLIPMCVPVVPVICTRTHMRIRGLVRAQPPYSADTTGTIRHAPADQVTDLAKCERGVWRVFKVENGASVRLLTMRFESASNLESDSYYLEGRAMLLICYR